MQAAAQIEVLRVYLVYVYRRGISGESGQLTEERRLLFVQTGLEISHKFHVGMLDDKSPYIDHPNEML